MTCSCPSGHHKTLPRLCDPYGLTINAKFQVEWIKQRYDEMQEYEAEHEFEPKNLLKMVKEECCRIYLNCLKEACVKRPEAINILHLPRKIASSCTAPN